MHIYVYIYTHTHIHTHNGILFRGLYPVGCCWSLLLSQDCTTLAGALGTKYETWGLDNLGRGEGWKGGYSRRRKKLCMKVIQSCPTLCDPMDYTAHGILQARILEWVASPFSRGSSQPRDRTQVSCIAGRFFTSWSTREAQEYWRW